MYPAEAKSLVSSLYEYIENYVQVGSYAENLGMF